MVILKSQKRRITAHDEVTSGGKRGFEESEVVSGCPTCRKRINTKGQTTLSQNLLIGFRLETDGKRREEVSVQSRKRSMHRCHADPCAIFPPTET